MSRGIVSGLLLTTGLLLSTSVDAQRRLPPTASEPTARVYSIRGMVRLAEDEAPAGMVRVDLRKTTGDPVTSTYSRTDGEFEFHGIPPGYYVVAVEEKGYEPFREAVELLNSSRSGVTLYLRKPVTFTESVSSAPISARELALPDKTRETLRKGLDALYNKKDFQGSLTSFQKVLKQAPNFYEAYYFMGVAYSELKQLPEAEASLRKSIEMSEGKFAEPLFTLGAILSAQKKFDEGEKLIRSGITANGAAWQGYYELARSLFDQNRVTEAEKSSAEALARNGNFAPLHLLRANIHIRVKDYTSLLTDLEAYLKLEPNGALAPQVRAMREKVLRNLENAKAASPAPEPKP